MLDSTETSNIYLNNRAQANEEGIYLNSATTVKLQQLMPSIRKAKDHGDIIWIAKGTRHKVFKLATNPDLVFKFASNPEAIHKRFDNIIKSKEVCFIHQLSQLVIPNAKTIDVEVEGQTFTLLAEEALDIDTDESAQEEHYHRFSTELNETARQLAVFIAKTGFNDVAWRNIPIINEPEWYKGPRRIGLIDLEHMTSIIGGFVGCANSRGLVKCLSEELMDIVIQEAEKQGVVTTKWFPEAKRKRLKELEEDRNLRDLHEKNGVTTGRETLNVTMEGLGLDLDTSGEIWDVNEAGVLVQRTVTLRQVTEDVIAEINRLIRESPETASTKNKRYLHLDTHEGLLSAYASLGVPEVTPSKEDENQIWLRRIIEALVANGHLAKLEEVNVCGYYVQG